MNSCCYQGSSEPPWASLEGDALPASCRGVGQGRDQPFCVSSQIYEYRKSNHEFPSRFSGRIQWNGSKDMQDVSITVLNVTLNDSGIYTCNITREFEFEIHRPLFQSSRLIHLTVVEEGRRGCQGLLGAGRGCLSPGDGVWSPGDGVCQPEMEFVTRGWSLSPRSGRGLRVCR